MVIDSGNKYYYLNFEDQRYDVEKWLDSIGVKAVKNDETTNTNTQEKTNTDSSQNNSSGNKQE